MMATAISITDSIVTVLSSEAWSAAVGVCLHECVAVINMMINTRGDKTMILLAVSLGKHTVALVIDADSIHLLVNLT